MGRRAFERRLFEAAIEGSDWRAADCLLKRIDPTWNVPRRGKNSESGRPIEANPEQVVVKMVVCEPDGSPIS
ncbi:MAG: hypothetical protein ACI9R3_001205 [Verrucomicrobiales bacterium]